VNDSEFCFTHAPERAKERARAHKRGGQNRITPKVGTWNKRIATIADALDCLNDLILPDLIALENTVPRARALIAAIESAIRAIDAGELETRLTALERILNEQQNANQEN
jgi:predicted transcriptional regulator